MNDISEATIVKDVSSADTVAARGTAVPADESAARRRRQRRPGWRTAGMMLAAGLVASAGGLGFYHWNSPAARYERGFAALMARDYERASYTLAGLPGTAEFEPRVGLLKGGLLLAGNQANEALVELDFALEDARTRPTALSLAGIALYQVGEFRLAERNWRLALQQDPDQVDAHRWLAIAYYDIGLMNQALTHLERVAELDLKDPRPHRMMGLIRMDYENHSEAIEDYQESLRRDPNQPDAPTIRLELAQTLMQSLRYPEALEELKVCEQQADMIALAANRYQDAGNKREARRLADKSRTLKSDTIALAAECHYNEGNKADARRMADKALSLNPKHRTALMFKARMALEAGDDRREAEILETVAKYYPNDYNSHYNLALSYQRLGMDGKAGEQMEQATRLLNGRREFYELHQQAVNEPYNAEVRYQLGLMADELGMPKMAKTWYRAAVAIDQNHFKARVALNKQ